MIVQNVINVLMYRWYKRQNEPFFFYQLMSINLTDPLTVDDIQHY